MLTRLLVAAAFATSAALPLVAQPVTKAPRDSIAERIRAEGLERSRVLQTALMLSDVLGPRLAGSAEYREAAEWARHQLASYGLRATLEPWGKRRGNTWRVRQHSVELVAPRYQRLVAYPRAWSPATDGTVRGTPIVVSIRGDSDLVKYRGRLKGAILLNGAARFDTVSRFRPLARRFTDRELDSLSRLTDPGSPRDYWEDSEGYAENVRRRQNLQKLMRDEGVAVLIEPSGNPNAVVTQSYAAYDSDVRGMVPAFIMARGDFDRLIHLVEAGRAPTLAVALDAESVPPVDSTGYNVVAELPGSDPRLASEVVMAGGHFDSWPSGTGATDNAAGVAVVMEAMRILRAVGAQPRRTIRVAFWDGEEHEDYFGSLGYVRRHFGDPETMKLLPGHAKLSAYFNLDNGTGRIRGLYLQGNAAARPVFAPIFGSLADLGASTLTLKNTGSTDHMAFVGVGLPGFTFIQDPIDYSTRTHHTNVDVGAHLMPDDLRQAAVVVAAVLWQVANLDEMVPRKPLPPPHAAK